MHTINPMFTSTQSQEGAMLTLPEATKILEECRRMVAAQRESFQRHLEEGRKVVEKAVGENSQLSDQLALARNDIAALKEQNAKLGQQNDFLSKQLASKQSSSLRTLLARVLKSDKEGLDDNEIEKQLRALFADYGNSLKGLQAEKQDLLTKLKDTSTQLVNSKNEVAKREPLLLQSAEVLRSEVDRNKLLAKRVKELEAELAMKHDLVMHNVEDCKKAVARLQSENSSLLQQAKTSAIENANLRVVVEKLKSESHQPSKTTTTAGGGDALIQKDLESQVKHWSHELAKEKIKHELTRQTLELAVANVQERSQESLRAAEDEARRLSIALAEEQGRYSRLEADLMAQVPDSSKNMSKEVKGMIARIKGLENTEKQLRKSMANKNNMITSLKIHNANLQKKIDLQPPGTEHPTPSPPPTVPSKRPRRR
ncbi:hypothetical protein BJV82DRAFT_610242 [Fennellomyces sp. T-0311]|nr:hypothetical protein BJV82DRAFT_610242 [Fennellomyces sp. T-0311]